MLNSPTKTSPRKTSSTANRPLRIKQDEFTGLVGTFGGKVKFTPTSRMASNLQTSLGGKAALTSVDRNRFSLTIKIDSKLKAKLRQTQDANSLHSVSNLVELNKDLEEDIEANERFRPLPPDTPPASSPASTSHFPSFSSDASSSPASSSLSTTSTSISSPASSSQASLDDLDNLTDLLQIPPSEFAMDLGDLFGAASSGSSAVVY